VRGEEDGKRGEGVGVDGHMHVDSGTHIHDVWKREQEGKKEGEGDNESGLSERKRWER
jgi:hypothetical protein